MPDVTSSPRRPARRSRWTRGAGLAGLLPLVALARSRQAEDTPDGDGGGSGIGSGLEDRSLSRDDGGAARHHAPSWGDGSGLPGFGPLRGGVASRSPDAQPGLSPPLWAPSNAAQSAASGDGRLSPASTGSGWGSTASLTPASSNPSGSGNGTLDLPERGGVWITFPVPGTGNNQQDNTTPGGTPGNPGVSPGGSSGEPGSGGPHPGTVPGTGVPEGSTGGTEPPGVPDGGIPTYPIEPRDPLQDLYSGGISPVPEASGLWVAMTGMLLLALWQRGRAAKGLRAAR